MNPLMRSILNILLSTTLVSLSALLTSCSKSTDPEPSLNESNSRIFITNDEDDLTGWEHDTDDPVPVDTGAAVGLDKGARSLAFSLTLVTEISPPSVNGSIVQATSVVMPTSQSAFVSYNFSGNPYAGGVDYYDKLTNKKPKLNSRATFVDSDISSIGYDGTFVYLAEATGSVDFASPAVLERLQVGTNKKFTLKDNLRVPLTSFVATSVVFSGNEIYAVSGDNGYLYRMDKSSMAVLDSVALDDARWVAWDGAGNRLVVLQGTPGRLSTFAGGTLTLLNTFSFPGADVPESKSAFDIAGGKAFVAAGPEGVQILSLTTGQIVGSVPRPNPAGLGLDSSVVVTNSVAVEGDLMFISNGEAGVYVAQGSQSFDTSGSETAQQITVLGKLRFTDLQSVNHVEYDGEYLYVAAGLGGLKIVRVTF